MVIQFHPRLSSLHSKCPPDVSQGSGLLVDRRSQSLEMTFSFPRRKDIGGRERARILHGITFGGLLFPRSTDARPAATIGPRRGKASLARADSQLLIARRRRGPIAAGTENRWRRASSGGPADRCR